MAKAEIHESFDSGYKKSALLMLYGGIRERLFLAPHPLGGHEDPALGVKFANGKGHYDATNKEVTYKDSGRRIKIDFGTTKLINCKWKVGAKKKGEPRNNVQLGPDKTNFGSKNDDHAQMSAGGMFTYGIAGVLVTTRMKVFVDKSAEVFTHVSKAGVTLACDARVTPKGMHAGYLGASYALPSILPGLNNAHLGTIVSLSDKRPSFGFFVEPTAPKFKQAVVGIEVLTGPQAVMFGAEVVLDEENSFTAKTDHQGIAHISFKKHFDGLDLQIGVEANLAERSCTKYGMSVTLI